MADINTSTNAPGSLPHELVVAGDWAYFIASDGSHGDELWRSDGTAAGTSMADELVMGPDPSGIHALMPLNHGVLFVASLPEPGLWFSNGERNGTRLVRTSSYVDKLVAGKPDVWYFTTRATDGATGKSVTELWRSDGTPDGTLRVHVVGNVDEVAVETGAMLGGALVFASSDGLWRTYGTEESTVRIADLGAYATLLAADEKSLVLRAGTTLWFTDGTADGTVSLFEAVDEDNGVTAAALLDEKVVFRGPDCSLWVVEPTGDPSPIGFFCSVIPTMLTVGDGVLFATNDGQLVRVDGSNFAARPVADLPSASWIDVLRLAGGIAFFNVSSPGGDEIWTSDGTIEGTHRLETAGAWIPPEVVSLPRGVVFACDHPVAATELCITDSAFTRTELLADLATGSFSATPSQLATTRDRAFFMADDGVHGTELWATDGSGARMVADMTVGSESSEVNWLEGSEDYVFALQLVAGTWWLLWRVDTKDLSVDTLKLTNSPQGGRTIVDGSLVLTLAPFEAGSSVDTLVSADFDLGLAVALREVPGEMGQLFRVGDALFGVQKRDGQEGASLWRLPLDSTSPHPAEKIASSSLVAHSSRSSEALAFIVEDELWLLNAPSFEVTRFRRPLDPLGYPTADALTVWDSSAVFFSYTDGDWALFSADPDGSLSIIRKMSGWRPVLPPVVSEGHLFFAMAAWDGSYTGAAPYSVWTSDGTPAGTMALAEVAPNAFAYPRNFTPLPGGGVIFSSGDVSTGRVPWVSDSSGTRPISSVHLDQADTVASVWHFSDPMFAVTNDTVYFAADDTDHGLELWSYRPEPSVPTQDDGCTAAPSTRNVTAPWVFAWLLALSRLQARRRKMGERSSRRSSAASSRASFSS